VIVRFVRVWDRYHEEVQKASNLSHFDTLPSGVEVGDFLLQETWNREEKDFIQGVLINLREVLNLNAFDLELKETGDYSW